MVIFFCNYIFILDSSFALDAQRIRETRKSWVHHDGSEQVASRPGFGRSMKDFPTSIKLILCNPTMMLITVVTGSEGLIVSGFATFMPKFFQEMYNLSAGSAAALSGIYKTTVLCLYSPP